MRTIARPMQAQPESVSRAGLEMFGAGSTTWSLTIDVKFSKTRETGYVAAGIW
jgi:hypothetical protein